MRLMALMASGSVSYTPAATVPIIAPPNSIASLSSGNSMAQPVALACSCTKIGFLVPPPLAMMVSML
ncbi:hypothetical protein D3C77_764530 [compost metagenome]